MCLFHPLLSGRSTEKPASQWAADYAAVVNKFGDPLPAISESRSHLIDFEALNDAIESAMGSPVN